MERNEGAIARYLAENLQSLRQKRGISQDQLAKLAGIPRTTLTSIESGAGNPSLSNLVKIAGACGVSVEEMLSRPRSECLLIPANAVPIQERNRGQAALYKLLPDKIKGLEIDRIQIKVGGAMSGHPHLIGTKEYMIGVSGEIAVYVAGEEFVVRDGDVLAFPGDQRHSYRNTGKGLAIAMSVVVPVPMDI